MRVQTIFIDHSNKKNEEIKESKLHSNHLFAFKMIFGKHRWQQYPSVPDKAESSSFSNKMHYFSVELIPLFSFITHISCVKCE